MDAILISEALVESGVTYYEHVYEVHINPDGWREPIPDKGFRAKDPNDSNQVRDIRDAAGLRTRRPHPLDGNGYVVGTATGSGGSGNTNVYLAGGGVPVSGVGDGVKKYPEISWVGLGF